jgi:hypothetical protein
MPTAAREEVVDHVGFGDVVAEFHEVVQHRRNDPRRAVGGRGDHAPAGGVFFVDRQGEQVDPLHRAQGRADHVGLQFLQAAVQLGRAAAHVQATGQDAFVLEALFDALLHGAPEFHQAGADLIFAAPGLFVGHHQLGDAQVVSCTAAAARPRWKIVGQLGAVRRPHRSGLGFIDHETAADRVVGVAVQLAVIAFGNQGHGVGVERQVLVEQAHVARPDKRHRQAAVQQQGVGFAQVDARPICVGSMASGHSPIRPMMVALSLPWPMPVADSEPYSALRRAAPVPAPTFAQRLNEQAAARMGPTVWNWTADADLEQVENADSHCVQLLDKHGRLERGATLRSPRWRHHQAFPAASASHTDALMPSASLPWDRLFWAFLAVQMGEKRVSLGKICKRRHRHWIRPCLYWIRRPL